MVCKVCGQTIPDGSTQCPFCGNQVVNGAAQQPQQPQQGGYQATQPQQPQYQQPQQGGYQPQQPQNGAPIPPGYQAKSKMAAGLLGIFLGGFGVHNFYLGYTSKAVIQIVVTVVTCGIGSLWGFVEGILILCGTTITTDANGVALTD